MINITILGSTGSIGQNTLDVIARNPDRFAVFAVSANRNLEILFAQCQQYHPRYAVVVDTHAAEQLIQRLAQTKLTTQVLVGANALAEIASHPDADYVVAAIVGAVGLLPTLAAVRAGKRVLLANKEALVMAGALFMDEVQHHGATLLPVDSEHNAIFQCMPPGFKPGIKNSGVKRLLITASGGAFRQLPLEQLAQVTPEQACTHPNWVMGRKVTVDSATMMNKALEVIEAYWLFGVEAAAIEVLLHPQSIVHSLVEYQDGSTLAQLGNPDMRTPIACALSWPERINSGANSLDLIAAGRLDFEPLCQERFPALALAYQALKEGGTATTILNAANEITVQAFLERQIAFIDIAAINAAVLDELAIQPANNLEIILAADAAARQVALRRIKNIMSVTPLEIDMYGK